MTNIHEATLDNRMIQLTAQLGRLEAEIRAMALRIETLHGKLDAALEIHERLAIL